ncbi:MAG: hypothetical protein XD60_0815 [Acetothermia bacterium 64_32]|nr:MAG: hypothetical protein XD60_0815 [Acetothermia bacterium 64_32]
MRRAQVLAALFLWSVLSLANEAWVAVTLDRIEFSGNLISWPAFKGNPIMFASVVGTGNTYQKLVWPWTGWFTIADEGGELVQETEAIPLFVLPADQMGSRLGIAIQFLGNTDFDWDHRYVPEVLSDLEKYLRRRLPASTYVPTIPGMGESEPSSGHEPLYVAHYDVFEPFIRVLASDAWSGDIRTFTDEVQAGHNTVRFQYSIRRVYLSENLQARVGLEGIKTVENGDFANGEVFILARAISGFSTSGAPAQRAGRIPPSSHYSMGDGEEKVLSAVLFEGEVKPFLYLEILAWDEDNPEVGDQHDLLGGFFGLWLPWRLSNLPGGEKELVIPKETPDGEVLFYLRVELLGQS